MANDQLLTLLNLSRKEVVKVWPKYGFGLKSLPNGRREMAMSSSTHRMSERVTIDIDKVQRAREIQKERSGEMSKGKNPKQVLIDWVTEVQKAATLAYEKIDDCEFHHAQLAIYHIIGQCETIMTVLKNSD